MGADSGKSYSIRAPLRNPRLNFFSSEFLRLGGLASWRRIPTEKLPLPVGPLCLRLTLSDKTEALEGGQWIDVNTLGSGSERLAGFVNEAENAQGSVRQRGERLGQARSLGVMTIFVPPAVFDEVEAVFHLPVISNVGLQPR